VRVGQQNRGGSLQAGCVGRRRRRAGVRVRLAATTTGLGPLDGITGTGRVARRRRRQRWRRRVAGRRARAERGVSLGQGGRSARRVLGIDLGGDLVDVIGVGRVDPLGARRDVAILGDLVGCGAVKLLLLLARAEPQATFAVHLAVASAASGAVLVSVGPRRLLLLLLLLLVSTGGGHIVVVVVFQYRVLHLDHDRDDCLFGLLQAAIVVVRAKLLLLLLVTVAVGGGLPGWIVGKSS
jgi:hypothetical protein